MYRGETVTQIFTHAWFSDQSLKRSALAGEQQVELDWSLSLDVCRFDLHGFGWLTVQTVISKASSSSTHNAQVCFKDQVFNRRPCKAAAVQKQHELVVCTYLTSDVTRAVCLSLSLVELPGLDYILWGNLLTPDLSGLIREMAPISIESGFRFSTRLTSGFFSGPPRQLIYVPRLSLTYSCIFQWSIRIIQVSLK